MFSMCSRDVSSIGKSISSSRSSLLPWVDTVASSATDPLFLRLVRGYGDGSKSLLSAESGDL